MERILIVDDEIDITMIVEEILTEEGYLAEGVNDGSTAVKRVNEQDYDLIILDIMMPNMGGLEVCRKIRRQAKCPIIFLTAKTGIANRIEGLNQGGDDYLTKPFSNDELLARIKAHIRREKRSRMPSSFIKYGNLLLNKDTHKVFFMETEVNLTNKEFNILKVLLERPGQIFSKDHLYEVAWGEKANGYSTTIAEHIRNIRSKIQAIDTQAKVIHTIWGVGYKIE